MRYMMNSRNRIWWCAWLLLYAVVMDAQVRRITLQDAVLLARTGSVEAQSALSQLRSSYWSYRSFRADQLPEVSLSATLPSSSRSYSAYQESTGAYT